MKFDDSTFWTSWINHKNCETIWGELSIRYFIRISNSLHSPFQKVLVILALRPDRLLSTRKFQLQFKIHLILSYYICMSATWHQIFIATSLQFWRFSQGIKRVWTNSIHSHSWIWSFSGIERFCDKACGSRKVQANRHGSGSRRTCNRVASSMRWKGWMAMSSEYSSSHSLGSNFGKWIELSATASGFPPLVDDWTAYEILIKLFTQDAQNYYRITSWNQEKPRKNLWKLDCSIYRIRKSCPGPITIFIGVVSRGYSRETQLFASRMEQVLWILYCWFEKQCWLDYCNFILLWSNFSQCAKTRVQNDGMFCMDFLKMQFMVAESMWSMILRNWNHIWQTASIMVRLSGEAC